MPLDSLSPKQSSESTFSGAKIADELQLLEDADIQKFIVFQSNYRMKV
jgi:hypothetical protein